MQTRLLGLIGGKGNGHHDAILNDFTDLARYMARPTSAEVFTGSDGLLQWVDVSSSASVRPGCVVRAGHAVMTIPTSPQLVKQ